MDSKEIALRLACAALQGQGFVLGEESATRIVDFYQLILQKVSESEKPTALGLR